MHEVKPAELAGVFAAARRHGAKTVLDVVTPGPGNYLEMLRPVLPEVDVFLPNDHEGTLITGDNNAFHQAELFHELGAKTAIVTMGERGSVLVGRGVRLRAECYRVPFVDGTGGGDAFAAGYICGLLRELDPAGCLRMGSAVGASCVRAIGTTTGVFTRDELDAFLGEQPLRVETW
jgi:sugar/nucleoside kinase (ribokinase family)